MKGIYALSISVNKEIRTNIGALGEIHFNKGLYAYVGSAQNNLEKRVKRHLRKEKVKFWHIDYLLDNECAKIVTVFWKNAVKSEECEVARELGEKLFSIQNFGCSDCNCISHLFFVNDSVYLLNILNELSFSRYHLVS